MNGIRWMESVNSRSGSNYSISTAHIDSESAAHVGDRRMDSPRDGGRRGVLSQPRRQEHHLEQTRDPQSSTLDATVARNGDLT